MDLMAQDERSTALLERAGIFARTAVPDPLQVMASPRGAVSLAVVMPVYNEERTVLRAVEDVLSVEFPCPMELIVVNDGSTDRSGELLRSLSDPRVVVIEHDSNRGKGAAIRTGIAAASSSHVVPFDADLEYRASDLLPLLEALLDGRADVVYGTRRAGRSVPHSKLVYALGNTLMTACANRLYGARLTDLHTCLKLVPREVFQRVPLLEEGFGLDTELTAWLLRSDFGFCEVPISYRSRTRSEGKKIGWRDSVACLHILLLIRFERAPS